ncbi:hypothetical protein VHUM_01925 [Vanrija humicola]|uniref:Phosphatidic acid phosphatase type 2/haloperoxidase domain-containing protein n=1 Tax=Vanrija humicola TaxID=5417 RepID=A0A7D8V274_VANHU|nr:hypothetical protein VHUM_01925 [Vanrija humicola]
MSQLTEGVAACFPGSGASSSLPQYASDAQATRGSSRPQNRAFTWVRLIRSYWYDWLLILGLWLFLAVLHRSPGHKREFSLTDVSIQHTFAEHERVPSFLLAVISAGIPAGVLFLISTLIARNAWDVHNALVGLGVSWTMAGVVTQIIKMMVGRPRPDLIARCLPREGSVDASPFGLSTVEICTQTDLFKLNDGFKSFPSGHSSLSFAGLGFLTFYLAGKLHLWDEYGHRNRAWFALSPLLLGATVAISRTMDNRHHWQDVLVGSALGLAISHVAYRTYYPNLKHVASHLPLLPRPGRNELDEAYDTDLTTSPRVRLLPEDAGVPRASEEQEAWRQ